MCPPIPSRPCSVALVGPREENDKVYHGAWHDEGRITRVFDASPYWMELGAWVGGDWVCSFSGK